MFKYQEEVKSCAFCMEVLKGRKKAEYVNKSYISIRGAISLQLYDKETENRSFYFVSNKPQDNGEPQEMNFCNTNCFRDFIIYKEQNYKKHREEQLRREASEIATHRVMG